MAKDRKLTRFSFLVIRHEVRKGHLRWKISEVAKEAKVSRAWVYKYHGKDKEEILENALRNTLQDFFLQSEERKEIIQKEGLLGAFLVNRKIFGEIPEVFAFYFTQVVKNNHFGKIIRDIEMDYIKNDMMKRQGLKNDFQGSIMRSLVHGMGLALAYDPEQTAIMMKFVLSPEFKTFLLSVPDHFKELRKAP